MMHQGITFYWKEGIQSCVSSGPDGIKLKLSSGVSLTADALLVAAGRKSNVEDLNLAATGLKLGDHDHINVDEHFRTESPHIYAAGDVIGFPALASTSMEQARRAIRHAFGLKLRSEISHLLPAGVYTIPEVGMVGETEESLHSKGIDYVVGRGPYEANARGRIIGDTKGFLKLLFRRDDMKLLGVHAIGEQATELVHIGLMAMLTGATADIFDEACFNVPTLGELYKYATLNAITHTDGEVAM
jgi:NAD(P) transhydrogenase